MTRREFITLIVGIVTACPAFLRAQQHAEQIWRIGYLGLSPASSAADRLASLRVGLADLGFVEGKNIAFDFRWAEEPGQLKQFAAELVNDQVAIIVSTGNAAALAAKSTTSTLPIVFSVADEHCIRGANTPRLEV